MNGSESCFKNNHPLDLGVKMNENEVFAPEMATGRKKKGLAFQPLDFACSIHGPFQKSWRKKHPSFHGSCMQDDRMKLELSVRILVTASHVELSWNNPEG